MPDALESESRERSRLNPKVETAIEIALRLGTVTLLVVASVSIMAPFLTVMVWALIMAIATEGAFDKVCGWLGGRRKLAALIGLLAIFLVVSVPTIQLTGKLVENVRDLATDLDGGTLDIPPPNPRVADWPVVGSQAFELWSQASENLEATIEDARPQLTSIARWLLKAVGNTAIGVIQIAVSILIAAVFLVHSRARISATERFALRMAGPDHGPELSRLAHATVRSVVQGIIGVAVAQSLLTGIGLLVAGQPAAGIWALLVLIAAIVQLPVSLVAVPPILIAYSTMGGVPATVLAIWLVLVSLLDNVLKPIFFGRGVAVPTVVVFMGALGGMFAMGILGLFLGAVVLAVSFSLFRAWLDHDPEAIRPSE